MKAAYRFVPTLAVALPSLCLLGCPAAPDGSADITTPAPCTVETDCPDGIACVFPNGTDQPGFCDVDEMLAP